MRKPLFIAFFVLSLLSSCTHTVPSDREYIITYSARMTDNDHVGSSWSKGMLHEGKDIRSGATVIDDNKLILTAYAEEDDSSPDFGSKNATFKNLAVGESQTQTIYLIVEEDRGRYAGNSALWKFVITVKRVK